MPSGVCFFVIAQALIDVQNNSYGTDPRKALHRTQYPLCWIKSEVASIVIEYTLCIVCQHPWLLLGMKERGFGVGKWNGFGGKLKLFETYEAAASRELLEEAGVIALSMRKMGILEFEFRGQDEPLEVHVFRVDEFSGEPRASEEMTPQWFHKNEIPYRHMWLDDQFWLPLLLLEKRFKGSFVFNEGGMEILEMRLETAEYLD
jgi:8-oxo-dGTP diphosphatase/2-hydroxy-dATP diphosphatase